MKNIDYRVLKAQYTFQELQVVIDEVCKMEELQDLNLSSYFKMLMKHIHLHYFESKTLEVLSSVIDLVEDEDKSRFEYLINQSRENQSFHGRKIDEYENKYNAFLDGLEER